MRKDYESSARVGESRTRGCVGDSAGPWTFRRSAVRGLALLAAAALLNLSAGAARANAGAPRPAGAVISAGSLSLNGSPAVSGQTFFPGSTIVNAPGARSSLGLSNLSRMELSGGTTLRLDFTESDFGGAVEGGGARFFVPEGVRAFVTTADASLAPDAGEAAVFCVDVTHEGTNVSVQSGRVEMSAGGVARTAAAGESLSALRGATPQPAPGQGLTGRQRAGIIVGITAAVLAVIFAVTRNDDIEPPLCEPKPIISSGSGVPSC
jgi:ferric-dicitrate binding protein FerR (iron transport regulator)